MADGQEESTDEEQQEKADDNDTSEDVDIEAFNAADVEGAADASSLGEGTEAKGPLDGGTKAASSLGEGTAAGLTYDQAKTADALQEKLDTYERARQLMEDIGDRSSALALARTIHAEKRKARTLLQQDPSVGQALSDRLSGENLEYARKRIAYNKERLASAEQKKAKQEWEELKKQTTAIQTQLRQAKSLLDCITQVKHFSPEMLGNGKAHGGPKKCRDLRFEVLDRLLAHAAPLSPQQKNDWRWFKEEWDAAMVKEHDKSWGEVFAGMIQNLLNELENGDMSAVSNFMYNETVRVLSQVPTLVL